MASWDEIVAYRSEIIIALISERYISQAVSPVMPYNGLLVFANACLCACRVTDECADIAQASIHLVPGLVREPHSFSQTKG